MELSVREKLRLADTLEEGVELLGKLIDESAELKSKCPQPNPKSFPAMLRGVSSGWRRPSTRLQYVIGKPLRLRRWKGCLWIDLDERIVESQRTREESQPVTAGGSRTI